MFADSGRDVFWQFEPPPVDEEMFSTALHGEVISYVIEKYSLYTFKMFIYLLWAFSMYKANYLKYHFAWVDQRERQGYKSDVSLKRGI